MRRNTTIPPEGDQTPLHFSIGSDSDEEQFPEKASTPQPPPIFRHIRDTHPPPSYAHIIVNRLLLRVFPRILLFLLIVAIIIALIPGGWRVGLCAADVLPPPSFKKDENITLIGHRGCEFPYPENTIQALSAVVEGTQFVEFDIALTSDSRVILMHDVAYNRSTNGTGLTCMQPWSYVSALEVNVPERDPRGRISRGQFCVTKLRVGTTPCTYRVPSLSEVFDALPITTRFMIDIKQCYAPGVSVSTALCTNCTVLAEQVKDIMEKKFINPNRVVFTSSEPASITEFRKGMAANSSYAIGADSRYTHYTRTAFLKMLSDGNFDSVSMSVSLAALRPDLVRAVRKSETPDGSGMRDVYAWTVRRDIDYKLARCAGVSKLIAAEPNRVIEKLKRENVGLLLSESETT